LTLIESNPLGVGYLSELAPIWPASHDDVKELPAITAVFAARLMTIDAKQHASRETRAY
jgi:hypothetical protein